jgi:hypothetical protein
MKTTIQARFQFDSSEHTMPDFELAVRWALIHRALIKHDMNIAQAAKALGMKRTSLSMVLIVEAKRLGKRDLVSNYEFICKKHFHYDLPFHLSLAHILPRELMRHYIGIVRSGK